MKTLQEQIIEACKVHAEAYAYGNGWQELRMQYSGLEIEYSAKVNIVEPVYTVTYEQPADPTEIVIEDVEILDILLIPAETPNLSIPQD